MSTAGPDSGEAVDSNKIEDANRVMTEKRKRRLSMKAFALVVVLVVVSASSATVWYFYYRHWTASELADNMIVEEGPTIIGFKSKLAGKTVTVEGKATDVQVIQTTLGTATVVELDNVAESSLVYWDGTHREVGDRIVREISFEWSNWNDDRHVMSPQVWLPLGYAFGGAVVRSSVSYVGSDGGVVNLSNEGNDLRIDVGWLGEPALLSTANCTLVSGNTSGFMDVLGLVDSYRERNDTDSISNLSHGVGWNDTIEFSDVNDDGYLDNGDSFLLRNLSRPDTESGIRTYGFRVEWQMDPDKEYSGVQGYSCYIPVIKDGVVFPMFGEAPLIRGLLEPAAGDARELTITYIDQTVRWQNLTIMLSDGTNFVRWEPVAPNPLAESLGIKNLGQLEIDANITSFLGNGIVNLGDRVTVSPAGGGSFSLDTVYVLTLVYEDTGSLALMKDFCVNDTPVARLLPCTLSPSSAYNGVGFAFTSVHVGANSTYRSFDLPWKNLVVNLTNGSNSVGWATSSTALMSGSGAESCFDNMTLGSLVVQLCVFDLNGDGQVNNGDRLELRTPAPSEFSSSTTYSVTAGYVPSENELCSVDFTG